MALKSSPVFTALINAASEAKEFGDIKPRMQVGTGMAGGMRPYGGGHQQQQQEPPAKKMKVAGGGAASMGGPQGGGYNSMGMQKMIVPPPKESAGGSSCHQCKSRRQFGELTYCTSSLDKKKKTCRKKYCEHCLKKFYKENAKELSKTSWKCPSCRKLCTCAACKRRENKGKDPPGPTTGQTGSSQHGQMPPSQSQSHYMPQQQHHQHSQQHHQHQQQQQHHQQQQMQHHQQQQQMQHAQRSGGGGGGGGGGHHGGQQHGGSPRMTGNSPSESSYASHQGYAMETTHAQMQLPDAMDLSAGASATEKNDNFAMLYAVAQKPNVNKQIRYYLARKDLTDTQKVESIASLLRGVIAPAGKQHMQPSLLDLGPPVAYE